LPVSGCVAVHKERLQINKREVRAPSGRPSNQNGTGSPQTFYPPGEDFGWHQVEPLSPAPYSRLFQQPLVQAVIHCGAHDETVGRYFDGPGRREAASGVSHYCLFLAAAAGGGAGRISPHGSDFFLHPDAP